MKLIKKDTDKKIKKKTTIKNKPKNPNIVSLILEIFGLFLCNPVVLE